MANNDKAKPISLAQYKLATRDRPLHLILDDPDADDDASLLPQRVVGSEAVCGGFEFQILCVSENATQQLKNLIGVPAELQIVTDCGQLRRLCGIVTEAASGQSDGGLATYQLVMRDAMSVMENKINTRVFLDKNELDIIRLLIAEWQRSMPVLAAAFDLHIDVGLASRQLPCRHFVLARRERVDPIRPFTYEDIDDYRVPMDVLNRDGVARRLFLGYLELQKSAPRPNDPNLPESRTVTAAEWLEYAAKFSVRPDIRGTGPTSFLDRELNAKHRPPADWKPTPWFPIPWSKLQLEQFDRMTSRGFVHRPIFVKTTDAHDKPLTRRDARQKALMEGLHQALLTLPEAERAKGPARVIVATNNQTEQLIALEGMLHQYAAQGGPEIDSGKLDQFINIDRRLGNTGAATLFMEMAIGVIGSYRNGGPSLAINLRDLHESTFIFISPPSEAKRKDQQHLGDVFRSINSPAIDPGNYAVPAAK